MLRLLFASVAFTALSVAGAADAGSPGKTVPSPIVDSNNQFSVDFAGTYLDYLETDTAGAPLDSERGWLPGLTASLSLMRNWHVDNLYLFGQFKWAIGNTNYVGALIGDPYGSFVNSDPANIYDADFRVGKGFDPGNNIMLTPFVGFGWHEWSRDLSNSKGPFGYHEDYSHWYAGAGVLLQVAPVDRLVLSASGLVGSTFDANISGGPNGGVPIIPFSAGLGSSTIFMAGLSADYAITGRLHANVGFDFSSFKYGQSGAFCVLSPCTSGGDFALEPDSQTSSFVIKAGLGLVIP